MRGQLAPHLKVGQRVRLVENGPVLVVERVNLCAAYVRSDRVEHVVLYNDDGSVKREFDARRGGLVSISPTSFVLPEDSAQAHEKNPTIPLDRKLAAS